METIIYNNNLQQCEIIVYLLDKLDAMSFNRYLKICPAGIDWNLFKKYTNKNLEIWNNTQNGTVNVRNLDLDTEIRLVKKNVVKGIKVIFGHIWLN